MVRLVSLALIALSALPDAPLASGAAQGPPLVILLAADRAAYRVGESATFTVAVDNTGPAPVPVMFASGRRYDVVAMAGDAEVWRWSADRDFPDAEAELSFPPGVTLLGRVAWDWRDATGAPLSPGSYRLVGTLTGTPSLSGNVLLIELRSP
jgi:hypothetical protein